MNAPATAENVLRAGVVEAGVVDHALTGHQLVVLATEAVGVAGAEMRERHAPHAAHHRIHGMHFADKAERWQPAGKRTGLGEGTVEHGGCGAQNAVQMDGMGGHGGWSRR
jgi:hypothetical protein